jgi:hypothetical protein
MKKICDGKNTPKKLEKTKIRQKDNNSAQLPQ